MTISEIQNSIREQGARIRTAAETLARDSMNSSIAIEEVQRQQAALDELNQRQAAMQASLDVQVASEAGSLPAQTVQASGAEQPELSEVLGSREYARAFASAVKKGVTPETGCGVEAYNVLYDAMTIGGNDGADGGFLVPEDIDHSIRERRRTLSPLAGFFESEMVTAPTGWRVHDNQPEKGMAAVDEMGEIPQGEKPSFGRVKYELTKYAMYLPVSNELASDNIANLFAYLASWCAKKEVITENLLLLEKLRTLTAVALAEDEELAGIKTALNIALDPAIAASAMILTNQSGFNTLDNLEDLTGHPLLQPDPVSGTPTILKTKQIHVLADKSLPNLADGTAPIYIGDFREFATMFARDRMEILSTNIGGNAFRTDSIEIRCIKRMGVSVFDEEAAVLRSLVV